MSGRFSRLAHWAADAMGAPAAFLLATASIIIWAAVGPLFGFSDTWQLWANTGTTIITFLMVFLVQSSQNRDGKAVQLKLDELIRATEGASNRLMALEQLSDEEAAALRAQVTAEGEDSA